MPLDDTSSTAADDDSPVAAAEDEQSQPTTAHVFTSMLNGMGFQPHQTAAFLGYMQRESDMQPGVIQTDAKGQPLSWTGAGRGVAQWTGGRRTDYENYMANQPNPYTAPAEADFMQHELTTNPDFTGFVTQLKATPDLPSASALILKTYGLGQFGSPGQAAAKYPQQWATLPERVKYGQQYLSQMAANQQSRGGAVRRHYAAGGSDAGDPVIPSDQAAAPPPLPPGFTEAPITRAPAAAPPQASAPLPQGFTETPIQGSASLPPGFTETPLQHATPAAPQWTKEHPYVPQTPDELDTAKETLPPGSWIKHPATGDLFVQPAPVTPEQKAATIPAAQWDQSFKGLTPDPTKPVNEGVVGTIFRGIVNPAKGIGRTAETLTGGTPTPEAGPGTVAEQPWELSDLVHPTVALQKILYPLVSSYPMLGGGILGAIVGGGAGAAIPVGGETGITEAIGAAIGGAGGAGFGTALQELGNNYAEALQDPKFKDNPHGAFQEALERTGRGVAGSAAGWALFGWAPFASRVEQGLMDTFGITGATAAARREALNTAIASATPEARQAAQSAASQAWRRDIALQAGAVQPAAAAAETGAENIAEGKPATEGMGPAAASAAITTGVLPLGHAVAGHFLGRGETPGAATTTPAGTAAPPPVGETFGMPMPDSETGASPVVPVTVTRHTAQGDVGFTTPDGTEHILPPDDIARLRSEIPPQEAPNAPPPEAPGTPPAAEAPPAEGTPSAPPQAAVRPEIPSEVGVPRTAEDIDREMEAERQAQANRTIVDINGQRVVNSTGPVPTTEAVQNAYEQGRQITTPTQADQTDAAIRQQLVSGAPAAPGEIEARIAADQAEVQRAQEPPTIQPDGLATALPEQTAKPERIEDTPEPVAAIPRGIEPTPEAVPEPVAEPAVEPAPEPERPPVVPTEPEPAPIATAPPSIVENAPVVTAETHTKSGEPIYPVRFPKKPDIDGLGAQARALGGYWSSYRGGGARPGWIFKTPESADQFAAWAQEQMGLAMEPTPPVRPEVPLAADEHPGLVIQSLQTGKRTTIQPRGTRPPSDWTEIGKNHIGQSLYEDQRGVRSYVENGVRMTEPVAMIPTRGGMQIGTDRTERPEYQVAEPHPTQPDRAVEYQPPATQTDEQRIGDQVVKAREDTEDNPTDAQIESGNYKHGRVNFYGLDFVMENPEGSVRQGVDPQTGERWESTLPADYGYISRTEGADGDHVDAYLGPDLASQRVYVVDQAHADTGAFDEHKVLLGYPSWAAAREAYIDAFSDGKGEQRIGNVTPMSLDELKTWLKTGDTKNPIGQQALALQPREPEPTLPTQGEENVGGIQGTVPPGDEGAGSEALHGPEAERGAGETPPPEDNGGPRLAGEPVGERPTPDYGEAPGGGRAGEGDVDNLPERGREPAEQGAAGRSPEPSGGVKPGRELDLENSAPLGTPTPPGREVDFDVKGTNFRLEPGALAEDRTPRTKAQGNLEAIELAKKLIAEGRPATREEQGILSRYVGWGGLSGAFPDSTGKYRRGFDQIGERLKQLLTPEEHEAAARSTQYAHYTSEPVIRAMWDAMGRLGFKGGSVFEPGMGVGHFLGLMPPDLAVASKYHGIEVDPLTAQIAKLLYPESGVRQADFIRTPLPEGAFDIAIGNPPFSDVVVRGDPKYAARGFMLHDYFFAKSLDSVRPGGLLGFVTSAGTMNKLDTSARDYLASRAEFVGGVRLPSTAFAKSAGTEVTTDILFFKKLLTPVDLEGNTPDWAQTVQRSLPNAEGQTIQGNVSRYFSEHPEQVLGQEGFFDKLYKGRYAVHAEPDTDLATKLGEAMSRLPENVMDEPLSPEEKAALDFSADEKKDGSFYLQNGQLMQFSEGAGKPIARRGAGVQGGYTSDELQTIRQLVPIRDALRDVYRADLAEDGPTGDAARAALNKIYDDFVKKNGPINQAEFSYRRPTRIQQEYARAEAREDARELGTPFDEGDFDSAPLIDKGMKASEIARLRDASRERAREAGRTFDEGTFDPSDMPDIVITKRKNIDPFMDDPESYRLRSIEDYNDKTGTASKRRIFFESVLSREVEPEVRSAHDGVLWSLNRFGKLDLDQIADKLGSTRGDVIRELGDSVYRLPGTTDAYEPQDKYLSGDVVSKLEEARAEAIRDPDMRRNVEALEKVQPPPLSPADISMRIGMPWIPPETVREFMNDRLNIGDTHIDYSPILGRWIVNKKGASYGAGRPEWGTQRVDAHEIMEDALNRTSPKVYDTYREPGGSTKRELNVEATQAAQDKVEAIRQAFSDWTSADPERLDNLAALYNNKFNRVVLRQWDGSYLTTPGVSKDWSWRPHQTRVIARIIQDGNTYMAHAVGSGKTSAAIGAAMEMRRLGLVNKPMVVVPNHMLGQFAKEWYEQYPTARLMIADERRFHTDRRRQFVADIAQQDLDGVIITNSAFKKIGISREFESKLIKEEVEKLDDAMTQLGQDPNELKRVSKDAQENRITVKKLQNRKQKLEERLRGHMATDVDQTNTFEELGVDHLFVDEAHAFRKLALTTQMNLKGISSEGSDMAWDLYAKSRYLNEKNPGRSLVLMSGTPVTNTMGELYTISRYLQPEALAENGLSAFDAWAQNYGETKTELEQTAQGTYEPVTRFSTLTNVPELYKMVGQAMDVVTPNQLEQYVTRPQIKGGERQFSLAPRTPFLDAYQAQLAKRVEDIKNRKGPPSKGDDILLSVINDGRLAAIDPRLVDPTQPSDPSSKLNQMIDNVHRIWRNTANQPFYDPGTKNEVFRGPGAQLVFSNLGIEAREAAGTSAKFSAYQWTRRELIRRGVPSDQIAFIRDYKTPLDKQRLFNDINDGKVRILVGSTAKMGTGLNVQRRLTDIHNLDPLWYPADDEQRVGRILRQGNLNPEIGIHDYSTKGTYDSTMWQMMGRKGRFIEQFFRGDPTLRDMDDLGEASMYEQASAMATSDERVIQLTEMRQDLQKTERRQAAHISEQFGLRRQREDLARQSAWADEAIARTQRDIAQRQDVAGDKFSMKIGRNTYDKRGEAATALSKAIDTAFPDMAQGSVRDLGTIGGFKLMLSRTRQDRQMVYLRHADNSDVEPFQASTSTGYIRGAEAWLRNREGDLGYYQDRKAQALQKRAAVESQIGKDFPDAARIEPLRQQIASLEADLATAKKAEPFDWKAFHVGLEGSGKAVGPDGQEYTVRAGYRGNAQFLYSRDPADPNAKAEYRGSGTIPELVEQVKQAAEPEAPEGLAEGEAAPISAAYHRDLSEDFAQHAAGYNDPHEAARDWVTQRGAETGNEHLAVYDAASNSIVRAGTSDRPNFVRFPDFAGADPGDVVIHHNHPTGSSLSPMDLSMLTQAGVNQIVAYGGGDVFVARLTPEFERSFAADPRGENTIIPAAAAIARQTLDGALRYGVESGAIDRDIANRTFQDLVNRSLAHAGLIDYMSSRDPAALGVPVDKLVAGTAERIKQVLGAQRPFIKGAEDGFLGRSTRTVRPEEGMAALPRGTAAAPADASSGIGDQGRGASRGAVQGLAEEPPPDFSERATEDAVEQAGKPDDTPGWWDRFSRKLAVSPKSPGAGDHFFNLINKDLTVPMAKARIDPKSQPKMTAELAKKRDAAALLAGYKDGLKSWQGQPLDAWRKQFAAMELLTLDGRTVPTDGRAIIVENTNHPLAALTKVGDVVRLTTPDEIKMFSDYRNTLDNVWKDLVGETAKQFGWEGEPTSAAIYRAAEEAGDTGQGRRLMRAAKIVAAVEYQRRDSYLPLMRSGDYFMRVVPKEGTDFPGWNGEGFPPTAMFKLIDSMTPMERAIGGIREGTPKLATDEIANLRKTFPEDGYDISHGYMFRSADQVKELNVPAIDKLMMLVSNDARGQIRDRLERTGMDKETARKASQDDYDKLVDTVLDRIYEERVAGFRRQRQNIPGYMDDFAKATGQYVSWLSSHISGMRHAADIDAANQLIDTHPDPRTRAFWRDWDRRQEDAGDQMNGPLMMMRHGAFLWLLGGNLASTTKILMHGPLLGVPVLTTGLGAQGRMMAAASYLNAAKDAMRGLRIGQHGIEINFDGLNLSAPERQLMKSAEAEGILHPQGADEMAAVRGQGETALLPHQRFNRRVLDIWASNISAADRMIRGSMLLAAYRTANREGMPAINRAWQNDLMWSRSQDKTPETFAKYMVDRSTGVWGDINRLPILRSQLGGMIGQFRNYELQYLSNLHNMLTRMGPEGKVTAALMLGGLGMLGGAAALPFVQDAEKAADAVYAMITGIAPDIENDLKNAAEAMIPGGGETFMHGARPFGVDLGTIGFGDVLSRFNQSPLDFAGAAVSTIFGGPQRAWERQQSGQSPTAVVSELMPTAVKHMMQALYPEEMQYSTTGKTKYPLPSDEDRGKIALGFQPEARAVQREQQQHQIHETSAIREGMTAIENRIANLHDRGLPTDEAMADAMALIQRGIAAGIYKPDEAKQVIAALRQKTAQRVHPELGTRSQQRFQAAQQQPASP